MHRVGHDPLVEQPAPIALRRWDVERGEAALAAEPGHGPEWVVVWAGGRPRRIVELRDGADRNSVAEVAKSPEVSDASTPSRSDDRTGLPTISVVIATVVQRVEELARCLDRLETLDYPSYEVILVDNRRMIPEDDALPRLLAGRRHTRSVRAVMPGISAARNAGIAAAQGDVVAFTDDDVTVDPGWLLALGRRFRDQPAEQGVTGLILPAELETPAQIWFERHYGGFAGQRTFEPLQFRAAGTTGLLRRSTVVASGLDGSEIRRFAIYGAGACGAGANMAFRTAFLRRSGGFDVALGTGTAAKGGEDLAAVIRLLWSGAALGYEPAAVVHHQHRRSYDELLAQMHGYGLGFTAMITSLVAGDARHGVALVLQTGRKAPRMLGSLARRARGRAGGDSAALPDQPPAELSRREFRGYFDGPAAYVRSRARARRPSSGEPEPAPRGAVAA